MIREVLTWFARRRRVRQLLEAKRAAAVGRAEERQLIQIVGGAVERGEVRVAALREQLESKRHANRILEARVQELDSKL